MSAIKKFGTDAEIKRLPLVGGKDPASGDVIAKSYKSFDKQGTGLYLFLQKNKKTFKYDYVINGSHKTITIGPYGDALTLKQARDELKKIKAQLAQGVDPCAAKTQAKEDLKQAAKAQAENENTLGKVANEWLKVWQNGKAQNSIKNVQRTLNKYILPTLSDKAISEIKLDDLLVIVRKSESEKKFILASRVSIILGQVFNFAILRDYIENDITIKLKKLLVKPDTEVKHRAAITEPIEVGKMLYQIDDWIKSDESSSPYLKLALQLLTYIPLRSNELAGLTWKEVDLENAQINIPKDRMKTKKPFTAYLSTQAINILREVRALPVMWKVDYIFQGRKKNSHINKRSMADTLARTGIDPTKQTIHGFRSTFSSICAQAGAPFEVVELCLSHTIGTEVSRAYQRSNLEVARRRLMQWYADCIDSLKSGNGMIELDISNLYKI